MILRDANCPKSNVNISTHAIIIIVIIMKLFQFLGRAQNCVTIQFHCRLFVATLFNSTFTCIYQIVPTCILPVFWVYVFSFPVLYLLVLSLVVVFFSSLTLGCCQTKSACSFFITLKSLFSFIIFFTMRFFLSFWLTKCNYENMLRLSTMFNITCSILTYTFDTTVQITKLS